MDIQRWFWEHDVEHVITVEQQVGQLRAARLAVQLGPVPVSLRPGDRQHARRKVKAGLGDQGLGQAQIDPAVEQLTQQVRAQPALPFLRGRLLG